MELTVRDVARLLKVPEKTIFRWIKDSHMPTTRVGQQYHFERTQLLEWATARDIAVSSDIFDDVTRPADSGPDSIARALGAGGIFHQLPATDKITALRAVVEAMRLPDGVDREFLLSVLLAREDMASTSVGDGVAIPHVRNPIILKVNEPFIALGFLATPMEYGALDGQPVFALFTMICPTPREHLHMLSRLAFALRDSAFKAAIEARAPAEQIIGIARRLDESLLKKVAS